MNKKILIGLFALSAFSNVSANGVGATQATEPSKEEVAVAETSAEKVAEPVNEKDSKKKDKDCGCKR